MRVYKKIVKNEKKKKIIKFIGFFVLLIDYDLYTHTY